ncbi:MAG: undecaprenyl/decaprenyl-phosphate alpha-N-acetylglucosaminyl 1-phosphate transferase [Candidatus Ancillula sp.]|jgi:UDP-GlcNAc:undecaprenyl-phosphate GlcNAc-1-phosphate transferase|nr:undecaprenyl/decaprenyl-phosphate alpha-N-acetylglucosaminyl 1-phosphate transferase [Candidatus Ancillula sp.]
MRYYVILVAISALVTFFATFFVRRIGTNFTRNELRRRDIHTKPVPRIGGIAMYFGAMAGVATSLLIPFFQTQWSDFRTFAAIGAAATLLCVFGVLDDIFNLDWMLKLAVQIISAAIVAVNGVQILSLPIGGLTVGSNRASLVLTILIIVAVINAINFIDGLDGLAAGVTLIGAIAFLVYSWRLLSDQYNYAIGASLIVSVLVGICIGFLPHNFYPAKIFMGDTGSQLLGFLLAVSVLLVTGRIDPESANTHALPAFTPLFIPFLVLILPLFDMVFAIIRRLIRGKSPFSPDRKHLHHRILDIGHTHRGTVLLLYLWAAVFAFGSYAYIFLSGKTATIVLLGISAVLLVATFAPKVMITDPFEQDE